MVIDSNNLQGLNIAFYECKISQTYLRSAFSSGLKCVSLCLFRTGGPADEFESESDDARLADDGKTTDKGRLKPVCEPLCFPDIRSTLCPAPVPAATTTMLKYPTEVV